jgi:hypothetical protein
MFPLVISTTVWPDARTPRARAFSTAARAARSFTLPPGCKYSALATIQPPGTSMRTVRVPPISARASNALSASVRVFGGFDDGVFALELLTDGVE